jgi:hypothetical protein
MTNEEKMQILKDNNIEYQFNPQGNLMALCKISVFTEEEWFLADDVIKLL